MEIKAKENIAGPDMKGLRALAEEKRLKRYLFVSLEPRQRTLNGGIVVLPFAEFLDRLWSGDYG